MLEQINSNKYSNLKIEIDHDFFRKFVYEIKLKNKYDEKSLEKMIEFCIAWDKKIDVQEI